jgi:hypothetical protein
LETASKEKQAVPPVEAHVRYCESGEGLAAPARTFPECAPGTFTADAAPITVSARSDRHPFRPQDRTEEPAKILAQDLEFLGFRYGGANDLAQLG